jgi:hypothetical protein
MTTRVQKGITAGMALVGAGVMAAMPVAQQAPEVLRSAEADVQLAAALTGTPAENLALSGQRTVTALVGAPVGVATAAAALAQGGPTNNAIAAAILKEVVDGPLFAADPAIYALDDLLPAPVGGSPGNVQEERGTSLITQFRADQLIAARDDINEAIRDSLGVGPATQPAGNEVSPTYAAARIGGGLAVSAQRAVTSAVTAPLGLVGVAQGLQTSFETGNNKPLYLALQAYIDAPNYVTDPIVFAADDVLPQPIGGDPQTNPAQMNGSEISRLRGNVLLAPRDAVRNLVAGNLGVNPVTGNPVPAASTTQLNKTAAADNSERQGPINRIVSSLKATPGGGASTESTVGKHRAPTTSGLSNLFKKKEDKKADAAPATANTN